MLMVHGIFFSSSFDIRYHCDNCYSYDFDTKFVYINRMVESCETVFVAVISILTRIQYRYYFVSTIFTISRASTNTHAQNFRRQICRAGDGGEGFLVGRNCVI